MKLTGNNHSNH